MCPIQYSAGSAKQKWNKLLLLGLLPVLLLFACRESPASPSPASLSEPDAYGASADGEDVLSSAANGQEKQSPSGEPESDAGSASRYVYTDPVEAAFHEYEWLGLDNKGLSRMSIIRLYLTAADIDFDGEKEIIITTDSRYLRNKNLSEVIKFDGEGFRSLGIFQNSGATMWYGQDWSPNNPYFLLDMDQAWISGTLAYYQSPQGTTVMPLTNVLIDCGQYDYEYLMEISLDDFSTTALLLHASPDDQLRQHDYESQYFYFDNDRFTYPIDFPDMSFPEPEQGYVEISRADFVSRAGAYMDSLTYLGDLELEHIGAYYWNSRWWDPSEMDAQRLEQLNKELNHPWELDITPSDTAEDISEKYQHAIADVVYQVFVSRDDD